MFMASTGTASKTYDEIIATLHLNKTTHSLEAYQNLLEHLTVNIYDQIGIIIIYFMYKFMIDLNLILII